MATWLIREFRRNQFDQRLAGDPDALYMHTICSTDGGVSVCSGHTRRNIEPILAFFNVANPEELTGRTFTTPDDNPRWGLSDAFQLLLLQARNGGTYTAPTHDVVRGRAIAALADLRLPDFGDVDSTTRGQALDSAWGGPRFVERGPDGEPRLIRKFEAHPDWVASLNTDLASASGGAVHVEQATPEQRRDFAYDCNCVSHAYLYLVRGTTRRQLIYHMGGNFYFDDRT